MKEGDKLTQHSSLNSRSTFLVYQSGTDASRRSWTIVYEAVRGTLRRTSRYVIFVPYPSQRSGGADSQTLIAGVPGIYEMIRYVFSISSPIAS